MAEQPKPGTTIVPGVADIPRRPGPAPVRNPLDGDANLQTEYEKLRDQTSEADKAGNAPEVARLKPLKLKAFQKWNESKTKAEQDEKERLRKIRA